MKKIVIAPDSFKESLSAFEAGQAIKEGLQKANPNCEYVLLPMADGGEGTREVITHAKHGKTLETKVTGPLGNRIKAKIGYVENEKLAIIEVADACGLHLVPIDQRNPEITTTYGVGELIQFALNQGARNFIIGLGGSSTNDGGFGMLQALGVIGKNKDNQIIKFGGMQLLHLHSLDFSQMDERLKDCHFKVACDVDNPLVGELGASYIFGPQKGANIEMVKRLDKAIEHYGDIVSQTLQIEVNTMKKAGAAGGLGAAFIILNAELQNGIDMVLEATNFENVIKDADCIFTGEGSIDSQTKYGKTISGIAKLSKKHNIPLIALGGRVTDDSRELYQIGVSAIFCITDEAKELEKALQDGYKSLVKVSENIGRLLFVQRF